MSTPLASAWQEIGDLTGPAGATGAPGDDGISITDAEINGSGDLIITLSDATEINAGRALGLPGGGIDFESSVPTVGDLPTDDEYGTARYVVADGHLYVWEEDGGGEGIDGWTDVGPIRGATGSTGPAGTPGTNGVSVTGAAIDGSGHLILTLSAGGPIDAGVARGADGADGADGTDGADGAEGEIGIGVIAYTAPTPPAATAHRVGTLAIGSDGKLLRAIA